LTLKNSSLFVELTHLTSETTLKKFVLTTKDCYLARQGANKPCSAIMFDFQSQGRHYLPHKIIEANIHSPKGLLGTPVQFFINAII